MHRPKRRPVANIDTGVASVCFDLRQDEQRSVADGKVLAGT